MGAKRPLRQVHEDRGCTENATGRREVGVHRHEELSSRRPGLGLLFPLREGETWASEDDAASGAPAASGEPALCDGPPRSGDVKGTGLPVSLSDTDSRSDICESVEIDEDSSSAERGAASGAVRGAASRALASRRSSPAARADRSRQIPLNAYRGWPQESLAWLCAPGTAKERRRRISRLIKKMADEVDRPASSQIGWAQA